MTVKARWQLSSMFPRWIIKTAVLRCPTCKAYFVAEMGGEWRIRRATKGEKALLAYDDPPSGDSTLYARTRAIDESEPPPTAEGDSDG